MEGTKIRIGAIKNRSHYRREAIEGTLPMELQKLLAEMSKTLPSSTTTKDWFLSGSFLVNGFIED